MERRSRERRVATRRRRPAPAARGRTWRLALGVLQGAPIWVPLALGLQIAYLGLEPALREGRRLEREERVLRAHHAQLVEDRQRLDLELRACEDPVYRARERKARLDPERPPR